MNTITVTVKDNGGTANGGVATFSRTFTVRIDSTGWFAISGADAWEPGGLHGTLSGVSQDVELAIWIEGRVAVRIAGALLWTHFGVSGPAALNASRHWLRARVERAVRRGPVVAAGRRCPVGV